MRIYVGNLAMDTSETQLRAMFEPHGTVNAARLPKDKETGAARGFGIVEMETMDAQKAISALEGCSHKGRKLRVHEAKPVVKKPSNGEAKPPTTGPNSPD